MQTWRKILTVFLVVLFAPATVLAAMPLHLCIGFDGNHRAIEQAISSVHHSEAAASGLDFEAPRYLVGTSPCLDVRLLTLANQSSRAGSDVKKPAGDDGQAALSIFAASFSGPSDCEQITASPHSDGLVVVLNAQSG